MASTHKAVTRIGYWVIAAITFIALMGATLIPAFAENSSDGDIPPLAPGKTPKPKLVVKDYRSDPDVQGLYDPEVDTNVVKVGDPFTLEFSDLDSDVYKIRISEVTPYGETPKRILAEKVYDSGVADTESIELTIPTWSRVLNDLGEIHFYVFRTSFGGNALSAHGQVDVRPLLPKNMKETDPPAPTFTAETIQWGSGVVDKDDPDKPKPPLYKGFNVNPSEVQQNAHTTVTFTGLKDEAQSIKFKLGNKDLATMDASDCPGGTCVVPVGCNVAPGTYDFGVQVADADGFGSKIDKATGSFVVKANADCKPLYTGVNITPTKLKQEEQVTATFTELNEKVKGANLLIDGQTVKGVAGKAGTYTFTLPCEVSEGTHAAEIKLVDGANKELAAMGTEPSATANIAVTGIAKCKPYTDFSVTPTLDQSNGELKANFATLNSKVKKVVFSVGGTEVKTISGKALDSCVGDNQCTITTLNCDDPVAKKVGSNKVEAVVYSTVKWTTASATTTIKANDVCKPFVNFTATPDVAQNGTINAKFDMLNAKVKKIDFTLDGNVVASVADPSTCTEGDGCAIELDCVDAGNNQKLNAVLYSDAAGTKVYDKAAQADVNVTSVKECQAFDAFEADVTDADQNSAIPVKAALVNPKVTKVVFKVGDMVVDELTEPASLTDGYTVQFSCVPKGEQKFVADFYKGAALWDSASVDATIAGLPECKAYKVIIPVNADGTLTEEVTKGDDMYVRIEGMKDTVATVKFQLQSKTFDLGTKKATDVVQGALPDTYKLTIPCVAGAEGMHTINVDFFNAQGILIDSGATDKFFVQDAVCESPIDPSSGASTALAGGNNAANLAKTGTNSLHLAYVALALLGAGMVLTVRRQIRQL